MEKTDVQPEIREYDIFKTEILTPDHYADICEDYDDVNGRDDWDELEYLSGDHPSYTRVYKTIRRTCAEQQEIIEVGRDLTLISLAFNLLCNLKELILVFCETKGGEDWESDYYQVSGMREPKSYEHHVQLVLAALKDRSLNLKLIQLTGLEPPDYSSCGRFHWNSLVTPLTELVGYASGLRLVESYVALALLCRVSLNIRELSLCSIDLELDYLENFLQSNSKSLRSLGVHDIRVIEQGKHTHLTPAHVGHTAGLTIERERTVDNLSSPCYFQEGWKLFFSAPNAENG
jgi:hypothetical protein